MRNALVLSLILLLAACGGGNSGRVNGEVAKACIEADRNAANPALCSCVQQAANQTLRPADRSRLVEFFKDPEEAHAIKINDSPFAEAFWDRYRNFIDTSRALCG